ncbi:MAG TPA: hypothetical protein VMA77_25645 [Solirubrobacteraceae bacterium]|nr:hypothetical protein [Solirubrobacteraceae bacterium]
MIDVPSAQPAYTLAEWSVRPKAEDAFVKEWTEFSEWLLDHGGAESFALLKVAKGARNYVSVGVWSGRGATVHWAEFMRRLGRCRTLCEQSQSRIYRPVALVGHASWTRGVDLAA